MNNVSQNELLDEIITMLMAALSLSGVKDECMEEALNAYEEELDKNDDELYYDYKNIVSIILSLKETRKELFK